MSKSEASIKGWSNRPRQALVGDRFGDLVVIEVLRSYKTHGMRRVRCDCGTIQDTPVSRLTCDGKKSCGCKQSQRGEIFHAHEIPDLNRASQFLINRLFSRMNNERCTLSLLGERSGVGGHVVHKWKKVHYPFLDNLDACFQVLGRRLWERRLNRDADMIELDRAVECLRNRGYFVTSPVKRWDFKRHRIPTKTHPLVKRLYYCLEDERRSVVWLEQKSGVSKAAILNWRHPNKRSLATIHLIDQCFHAVGRQIIDVEQDLEDMDTSDAIYIVENHGWSVRHG